MIACFISKMSDISICVSTERSVSKYTIAAVYFVLLRIVVLIMLFKLNHNIGRNILQRSTTGQNSSPP